MFTIKYRWGGRCDVSGCGLRCLSTRRLSVGGRRICGGQGVKKKREKRLNKDINPLHTLAVYMGPLSDLISGVKILKQESYSRMY